MCSLDRTGCPDGFLAPPELLGPAALAVVLTGLYPSEIKEDLSLISDAVVFGIHATFSDEVKSAEVAAHAATAIVTECRRFRIAKLVGCWGAIWRINKKASGTKMRSVRWQVWKRRLDMMTFGERREKTLENRIVARRATNVETKTDER